MNTKKNPKYDLERRRKLYFNLGLLVAGSITLAAFKWGTPLETPKAHFENKKRVPIETYELEKIIDPEKQQQSYSPPIQQIIDLTQVRDTTDIEVNPRDQFMELSDIKRPDFNGPEGLGSQGVNTGGDNLTIESEDAEVLPEFPGGDGAMAAFIVKNYKLPKHYDITDQGTIYVRFVVTAKGDITDVSIARGINREMDREAMRVVETMPSWTPGKYRGRNVSVRMVIPIKIRYQ
jgi:periplasmic protein TonB